MKILLAVLLFTSLACAQLTQRWGFCVGTTSRACDIVKDGVTQQGWNSAMNPFVVSPGLWTYTWYTWLNNSADHPMPTSQYYNTSFVTRDDGVYELTGTGLNDTIIQSTFPDVTMFTFGCLGPAGISQSVIKIELTGYESAYIYFQHMCQRPATFNLGLELGVTGPTAPMVDGQIRPDYTLTSNSGESFTRYYAWLTNTDYPPQQFAIEAVVTPNPDSTDQLKTDVVYTGGSIANIISMDLPAAGANIYWECPTNSVLQSWNVDVHIKFGFKSYDTFHIVKYCGKPPNPRLGLEIGLERNGSEVCDNGVSRMWNASDPRIFTSGDIVQELWLWLHSGKTFDDSQQFWTEWSVQDPTVVNFVVDGAIGTAYQPTSPNAKETIVKFSLFCLRPGSTTGILLFKFDNDWDPVQLYFYKNCSVPLLNVGVTNGNLVFDPNVVKEGVVQNFVYTETVGRQQTLFTFWVPQQWVENGAAYQQYLVNSLTMTGGFMEFDYAIVNGNKAYGLAGATVSQVLVQYRCASPPPESTGKFNMTLNLGWEQTLSFSWIKHCGPPSSGSSGWSPFGIFAFTVFILILVWCLVGCAYNYVAKDQRGADAIPGINLYRSCYQRCFPAPRYTPQTDYNYDKAPDYGGTSYQSENL